MASHEDLRGALRTGGRNRSVIEVNHGKAVFAKNHKFPMGHVHGHVNDGTNGEARISMVGGDMAASMTNTCSSTASQSRPSSGCTALATVQGQRLQRDGGVGRREGLNHQVGDRSAARSVQLDERPLVEVRPVKGSPPSRSRV